MYYVEDFSDRRAPAAPEGYKPFYINGFFRHGARQVDDNITYASVYGSLALAESQSNLTGLGKAVYERLKPFRKNIEYREADLTQLGWRQSVTLGERMVDNYPEVFEGIKSESEGIKLVKQTAAHLVKRRKIYLVPKLVYQSGYKYIGYRMGKMYKKLPDKVVKWCSMSPGYWEK